MYAISGIDPAPFRRFFGQSEHQLAAAGVIRVVADKKPGFPCRVTLTDAEPGDVMLLINYEHLPVESPYRSCHAIYVRDGAAEKARMVGHVPEQLRCRLLSVRAFDALGMMTDADVVDGSALEPIVERMLADPAVDYLHVHNAKRGCFAARIDRA